MDNSKEGPVGASGAGSHTEGSVGEAVRAARKSRRMTLAALAERVGCARTYLSAVETGKKRASVRLLGLIERALRVKAGSLAERARWEDAPASMKAEVARARRLAGLVRAAGLDELHRSGRLRAMIERMESGGVGEKGGIAPVSLPVEVPLINSVAAGYPTEFTDLGYPARVADEYVRSPDIRDPDAFAARVVGDSMQPEYREGDIVIFSPAREVKSGMDCFVRLERDGETTFKRVFFEEGAGRGEMIRLQPLNGRYGARVVPREEVSGLYAAVSVMRSV